ncbi:hypothetical protein Btru_002195 [Bulinus truncatus]|nr:hypothetical protein Btru_002195 [Bulinus truncatus]
MAVYKQRFFPHLVYIALTLAFYARPSEADQVCDYWGNIARSMTSSLQSCTNEKTKTCTRLDCSGTVSFSQMQLLPRKLQFDYCFGAQLNSCNVPISIDFYLQVPDRNVSFTTRISQDKLVDIPGIAIPLGELGRAEPKLKFQFEKNSQGNIKYSVMLLVYVAGSEMDMLKRTLIDSETIHALPCAQHVSDISGQPSSEFNKSVGQCHGEKISTPIPPTVPTRTYTPSVTLNKTCDARNHPCGHLEMCDLSSRVCRCLPEATLSLARDACINTSNLGAACSVDSDCSGPNMQCKITQQGQKDCQCKDGYSLSIWTDSCAFVRPGNPNSTPSHQTSKDSEDSSSDTAYIGKIAKHNLPMIVGASLGGAMLVGLLVWLVMYWQHGRRRRQLEICADESRAPMLSSRDDDNLII